MLRSIRLGLIVFATASCGKVLEQQPDSGGTELVTVSVSRDGAGAGRVTGTGIDCGTDCSEDVAPGTTVMLTATADANSTFTGWSGGGCTGTGTCSVTATADTTVTAAFAATPMHVLTVAKSGTGDGTVTSSVAGIACGADCMESYPSGASVTLTAVATTGQFAGWTGGGCTGLGTCTTTINAATTVTARFSVPQTAIIDVKVVGGNYWRGWHVNNGTTHLSSNDNTITGAYQGGSNSYFVFPLAGFSAAVVLGVVLELSLEYYVADASETLSVWDVSTPSATVEADGSSTAIYMDLMTGNTYGTKTFTAAQLGTVLNIPLNVQAGTDILAAQGNDFTLGIHLDTGATGAVRFSDGSEARTHRLTITYLP